MSAADGWHQHSVQSSGLELSESGIDRETGDSCPACAIESPAGGN
jgi:hypothetical protein